MSASAAKVGRRTGRTARGSTADSQRLGGAGALVAAATFVVGFVMAATVLSEYATGDRDGAEMVAFVTEHRTELWAWHLIILVVFGLALVPLVLALRDRLKDRAMNRAAMSLGLTWAGLVLASGMIAIVGLDAVETLAADDPAQAVPVWIAVDAVQIALGGGVEIVGALWVLLVSATARRERVLPSTLTAVGIVAGGAGVLTVIPALEALGAVFGLGLIVWFAWAGNVLLRSDATGSAPRSDAVLRSS